jgi:hypothetical protein
MIQEKMTLPIDNEIIKMRVQKDIDGRYRMELETRALELERMTDAYYDVKRQLEIFKTSLENQRYETEKIVEELRDKSKQEISELV